MHKEPETLAERIAAARAGRLRFEPMPELGGDLELAYGVQDAVLARWAPQLGPVGGWKVGLTTPRMQQMCGVAQPVAGAIFASLIRGSPVRLRASEHVRLGLEFELAFRVGETPPPSGRELDAESVRPFLDAAAASFEVIDDRGADYGRLDAASLVADNAWNRGLVLSQPRPLEALGPVTGLGCVLELDGAQIDAGRTDDVGGDPLAIVAWLGNALSRRGRRLQPGQWIMTGSMVPTRFAEPGQSWRFEIEGFEPVAAEIE